MMRSESTSALGQPRLTKPILGGPILGPLRGGASWADGFGMGAPYRQARDACLPPCIKAAGGRVEGWMKTLPGQMLTTRGAAAFWLLWSMALVLMLWAVSPGRTLQDALAAELLQGHLAGGYQLRNPPLYEWLLWGVQQVVGPGLLSYLILRYALIATTGILFTLAVQRTVGSARVAAAFSLSLVLFFWFGWEIHQSVSHTLALLAAVLALFIVSLAYAERPTAMRAFLLGLIMGLGLMAKWSFLLVLLSLGVASP